MYQRGMQTAAAAMVACLLATPVFAAPPGGAGMRGVGGFDRPGGPRFIGGLPDAPQSLRDALFGSHADDPHLAHAPPVARYRLDAGEGFVVDRQDRGQALFKLEDAPEVWVLTPTPGPRGDVIFKNDVGEPVLRATRMGGLTLFTADRPEGEAAALASPLAATALRDRASLGPNALYQILGQASARASRAAGRVIVFDAPDVTPKTDWAFADAASLAAEAFARGAQSGAKALLARFFAVKFVPGRAAAVAADGQTVRIVVAPDRGPAGRPSSQRILLTLVGR